MHGMTSRTPAAKPGRRRDPNAPPKPKRPRDELGRPLSWKAENRLRLEDYDSLPIAENHRLAVEHFNAERFFPAHEAWETCWKQGKETPDAEFFKGLSQLGAGFTHLLRGNRHGAHTLLRRGAGRILRYESPHRGVDVWRLGQVAQAQANLIERAEEADGVLPSIEFPKI
jgi:predicted metal-dependent hydrolase